MTFQKLAYTPIKIDASQNHSLHNKIVFRGSEAFYGNEQVVYYEPLDDSTKTTQLPIELGFTIAGLQLNDTGSFLAVYGDNVVVIVLLPAPGVLAAADKKPRVKNWRIDLFAQRGEEVLKAVWNPVSRFDSELVVLTDANRIYSFDVLENNNVAPDQEITLQLSDADTSLYGQLEIVSFCFGKGDARLSLYVLASDGNVYALAPFVPKTFVLTRLELEALFDRVVLAGIDNKDSPEHRIYQKQVNCMNVNWLFISVLKLYRMCIRQVYKKPVENQPQFLNFVREEFYSKRDTINRKDFGAIEYLLRKGNRMLEVYGNPLVKNISS
ncbi:hypothetical protein DV451_004088 [Geotrichum candidum]|uniref:Complex 1 LYR protein domain-containing protein n=1 Tax=Geotrichum candidum TaxID=1173061 RepID=A0A9P5G1Z8_GEOCN|nr:hypothetical protein DV451_004088 [Geotrichum candidum]KAF5107142.1 hypothetical protein DV453_003312 [Geotrichum candidum]